MVMKHILLALLMLAATPLRAETLRPFTPDRPDKTEGPFTVPPGRFQVELDLATYTRDDSATQRLETVNVAPMVLKAGVGSDTDIELIFESYLDLQQTDRLTGDRSRIHGIGDLTLRVKHNFWGNDGGKTALGIIPFVTIPTSTDDLGNQRLTGGVILPFSTILTKGVDLGLMTEVDLIEGDTHRYAASFVNSASVSFDLTEKLGLYAELYTEKHAEQRDDWIMTGDTGLTYKIGDNAQIDGGVNVGLTDAADDINLFVGAALRF